MFLQSDSQAANLISSAQLNRVFPLALDSGEGPRLIDETGREYIDFTCGSHVALLGYSHPRLVAALTNQLQKLNHNCLAMSDTQAVVELAHRLVTLTPGDFPKKVWFGTSGSDANDFVYKIVRFARGRSRIVTHMGSYHGITLGAAGLSGWKSLSGFITLSDVVKVPYPYCYRCAFCSQPDRCGLECFEFLRVHVFNTLCDPVDIAAFVVEPIMGDGGVIVPPHEYMTKLANLAKDIGALLVADEVLVGLGRTGRLFACEHFGWQPDLVVMGKALGGGIPLSAVVGQAKVMDAIRVGQAISTGGSILAAVAANVTLDILSEGIVERATELGAYLETRLRDSLAGQVLIGDVRGLGMLFGLEIESGDGHPDPRSARAICYAAWQEGVLVRPFGIFRNVVMVAPPLTIERHQLDLGLERLLKAVERVEAGDVGVNTLGPCTGL